MNKQQVLEKASGILLAAIERDTKGRDQLDAVTLHVCGYAEPGYRESASGVIATGNWNTVTRYDDQTREFVDVDDLPARVGQAFEHLGIELEWEDEWIACSDCGKLYRSQGDSYHWTRYGYESEDGEKICGDCVRDDETQRLAYLETLEGNHRKAVTIDGLDLAECGYVKLNTEQYEHGLHEGQADSPEKIAKALEAQGVTRFVFTIDSAGQFDIAFSVWIHQDQIAQAVPPTEAQRTLEVSPAEACRQALQAGTVAAGKLEGDGVKYIKCHPDGTATARLVSPEEFAKGIKE